MNLERPVSYLRSRVALSEEEVRYLSAYEAWWMEEGARQSSTVDRARTPWLRMYDERGERVDEILYPSEYWTLLDEGYRAGHIWRVFEENRLRPFFLLGYVTSFWDPGLYCPYTVSISTAVAVHKYAPEGVRERVLEAMIRKTRPAQGATWMTEIRGGSDLGAGVETVARREGDRWRLSGLKYFASNAGAEYAIVAARPEGAPRTVRGLALFLLPRFRQDGSLNYTIQRLKDKIGTRSVPTGEVLLEEAEAWLLGKAEEGIYLILEALNISRVANSVGSVALAQRALAEAVAYARTREAFGKPIAFHPLLAREIQVWEEELAGAFALAWWAVELLDQVWQERPRYSARYHLFRLVAHLAKYWTAEVAVRLSRWAIEVYGGIGILEEMGVERLLREALILPIWEGTPHRQVLDALEAMERKQAHRLLLDALRDRVDSESLQAWERSLEEYLALPAEEKEARAREVMETLARWVGRSLAEVEKTASRMDA